MKRHAFIALGLVLAGVEQFGPPVAVTLLTLAALGHLHWSVAVAAWAVVACASMFIAMRVARRSRT